MLLQEHCHYYILAGVGEQKGKASEMLCSVDSEALVSEVKKV